MRCQAYPGNSRNPTGQAGIQGPHRKAGRYSSRASVSAQTAGMQRLTVFDRFVSVTINGGAAQRTICIIIDSIVQLRDPTHAL